MAKASSRRSARSGVIKRSVERRTFDDFPEFVAANNKVFAKETFRETAEHFLDLWEKHAFEVYGRYGLPTFWQCWRAGPEEPWRSPDERPESPARTGERFTTAYLIGEDAFPPDTEVGFATAILRRTYLTRSHLRQVDDYEAWRAFAEAATVGQDFHALVLEFGYAAWLGSGRKQAEGRRNAGLAAAEKRRKQVRARVAAWLTEDAKIATSLSLRARAAQISRKLRGTQWAASESTIRKALAKNGSRPHHAAQKR